MFLHNYVYDPNPRYVMPIWYPKVIPGGPTYPATPVPAKYSYCPVCGIKLYEIMGYVCGNQDCPVFPQVTCELS
jgi:hypothetical protein